MSRVFTVAGTSFIDCGDIAAMDGATNISWSFWYKKDNIGDGIRIGKMLDGTHGMFFNANVDGSTYFGVRDGGNGRGVVVHENTGWNHAVCVFNGGGAGDADKIKLYINRVNQTLTFNNPPDTSMPASNTASFDIGQFLANYSDGHVARVKSFARSLNQGEVNSEFNEGRLYADIGYWPFESDSSPEQDLSGNGNSGTLTNAPAYSDNPPTPDPFGDDDWVQEAGPLVPPVPPSITSLSIHYAVDLDISDNTDIADQNQIGLFNDALLNGGAGGSAFRWTTDRPDYDGSTITPTGDLTTANAVKWGEAVLLEQKKLGTAIRMININVAGGYGSLSGFKFHIDNTEKEAGTYSGQTFADILEDNAMYVINRIVRLYIVIDNVFYNYWTGVVSKVSHDRMQFTFICEDNFKDIHKVIPPQIANETLFPNIIKKSIGKTIPVTFGLVNNAKLLNIQTLNDPIDLNEWPDIFGNVITSKIAPIVGAEVNAVVPLPDSTTFWILIGYKSFEAGELGGKFIRISLEGSEDSFHEIITNTQTDDGGFSSGQNFIAITVTGALDISGIVTVEPQDAFRSQGDKGSWLEVFDFESVYIVSNRKIAEFPNSDLGFDNELSYFDKDTEEFTDLSDAGEKESLTNIGNTGFPGVTAFTNATGNNEDYSKQIFLKPKRITLIDLRLAANAFTTSSDFPAIGQDLPNLCDKDIDSKYTWEVNRPQFSSQFLGSNLSAVVLLIEFPEDIKKYTMDEVYVVADYDIEVEFASAFSFEKGRLDVFNKSNIPTYGGLALEPRFLDGGFTIGEDLQIRLINPTYYTDGVGAGSSLLKTIAEDLDMKIFYDTGKPFSAFPFIELEVLFGNDSDVDAEPTGEDIILRLREIAFAGIKNISISNEDIYVKARGEWYETTGPVDFQTSDVKNLFLSILVNYDGLNAAADIDVAEIGDLVDWKAGRQLNERKSSFDYLKQLAEQTFTGLFPTRKGLRKLKAYRNFSTVIAAFASDNGTILKDSITKFELSPINEVYNEFDIKYDFNIASGKYEKSIFIKKTGQASTVTFPDGFLSTGPGLETPIPDESNPGDFTAHTDLTISIDAAGKASAVITYAAVDAVFVVGGFVSLNDVSPGLGIIEYGRIIEVTATTVTFTFNNIYGFSDGDTTATGIVFAHGTGVPLWNTYVGGYNDYNTAKKLWDICHNSFLRTLVVRALPKQYAECPYFVDESNFGADPGDFSTAHKYLELLTEWATRQKENAEFSAPITVANVQLEELDFVTFKDAKFTSNELRSGYITKIKLSPGSDSIVFGLTLIPADIESANDCLIVETGLHADTIVESGTEADTIVELGTC